MPPPPRLLVHEWSVVLLFCVFLLLLALLAWSRPSSPPPAGERFLAGAETELKVFIGGEVAKPGPYLLPLKSCQGELVARAEPLPSADLSGVRERRRLRQGERLFIPERRWITVQVSGAVHQPGPLRILSGTRCSELLEQLAMTPEADPKAVRKKGRFLQEGEVVEIPFKQKFRAISCSTKF